MDPSTINWRFSRSRLVSAGKIFSDTARRGVAKTEAWFSQVHQGAAGAECVLFPHLLSCWVMTHIFTPWRFSSRVKAKVKRHVSFHFFRLYPRETPLQAASPKPHLTYIICLLKCVLSMCLLNSYLIRRLEESVGKECTGAIWEPGTVNFIIQQLICIFYDKL